SVRRRSSRESAGVPRREEFAACGCASVATSRVRKRHREATVADLGRAGLDFVVVALVGDEDMTRDLKAPGVIERTGGDADVIEPHALPQQRRAATPAETEIGRA